MRSRGGVALVAVIALAATSCLDPVHSDEVAALGGETNGERTGEFHRAGQPCLVCHGGQGPASAEFVVAGTVFARRDQPPAQPDVTVVLTAANSETKTKITNRVGNFFIRVGDWSPTFPLKVELDSGSTVKAMNTTIGRNGSCAFCHYGADNEKTHMPPVFLNP